MPGEDSRHKNDPDCVPFIPKKPAGTKEPLSITTFEPAQSFFFCPHFTPCIGITPSEIDLTNRAQPVNLFLG